MNRQSSLILGLAVWAGFLGLFASCNGDDLSDGVETGTIAGYATGRCFGTWPPDSCMVVSTRSTEGEVRAMDAWQICWPPDSCAFGLRPQEYGAYLVALERVDSLFWATGGSGGTRDVISYYTNDDTTSSPSQALPVELSAEDTLVENITIRTRSPEDTTVQSMN